MGEADDNRLDSAINGDSSGGTGPERLDGAGGISILIMVALRR